MRVVKNGYTEQAGGGGSLPGLAAAVVGAHTSPVESLPGRAAAVVGAYTSPVEVRFWVVGVGKHESAAH